MEIYANDLKGNKYNRIVLVFVMLIGAFCIILNQTILATAYPAIMSTFDISLDEVQWLTTVFLLVMGITLPFSAILMKKIPSNKLFIIVLTIFLIGTIVCGIAFNFYIILLGRIIQAVGAGIAMPLLQTSLLNIFAIKERGVAMGIVGLVIALAPSIGPTLSGYVVDAYDWRFLFWIIIPIVVLDLIACFIFLREVIPLEKSSLDFPSVILSIIGFGGLLYGFSIAGTDGFLSPLVLSFIIGSGVILFFFVKRQLKLSSPLLRFQTFQHTIFAKAIIIIVIVYLAMIGFESILPLFLQKIHGETAFHSGLLLLPGAVLMGVMSPITGNIFDKYGARNLAITGLLFVTLGTATFLFIDENTPTILIVVFYSMRLFGISMVLMPISTHGLNQLPNQYLADGSAIQNTLRQIGGSIGTAILVSSLTIVTINNMPSKDTGTAQYFEQIINANITGYHVAFGISLVFCIGALITTFKIVGKGGN